MKNVHIDGKRIDAADDAPLSALIPGHPLECAVAVISPATQEQKRTASVAVTTTAGEVIVESAGSGAGVIEAPVLAGALAIHWADRYAAAFGPFPSSIKPDRKLHLYERGDVILGCGGYDPGRSYLIFSRSRHSADHGADASGGVIGRVVSGMAVLDKWTNDDRISAAEPVISWADTDRSFTTSDPLFVPQNEARIVTYVGINAQGFSHDTVITESAEGVEHLLLALRSGRFRIGRATSTHILASHLAGTQDIPAQLRGPRREGTVTVRTQGKSAGGIYIYKTDIPASLSHNVVGRVVHGIELVRLAKPGDLLQVRLEPERIDLLGLPLGKAQEIAAKQGVALTADKEGGDRIVVSQEPGTTLDLLNERKVAVTTAPAEKVIDIELYDEAAPNTCEVFRRFTGLREHDAGVMPVFFKFDDVILFKPPIATGVGITPENTPHGEVPAATLAMTNDSRKGAGTVGIRFGPSAEFGPTSEPFEGTNIIGRVIDWEKLKKSREREKVYIREVRQ